jgi:hypothetical protein
MIRAGHAHEPLIIKMSCSAQMSCNLPCCMAVSLRFHVWSTPVQCLLLFFEQCSALSTCHIRRVWELWSLNL